MSLPFIDQIIKNKTVGVFSHIRPDGDAIGSQIAASLWLNKYGIKAYAFNDDSIPENLAWMLPFYPIQKPTEVLINKCDAFLMLDGNKASRFGHYGDFVFKLGKPIFLIDHHPEPDTIFTDKIWTPSASSTAELVFHLYLSSNIELLGQQAAKALYAGLVTDTGSFRFSSVTPEVHTIAAELLSRGRFSPPEVHEKIYDDCSLKQVRLLGKALNTVDAPGEGKIGVIVITKEMFNETETQYSDTEGFVSYALSLKGTEAAVLLAENNGKIKLSLRSKRRINCNEWAKTFGGGGHFNASGAWFSGSIDEALTAVLERGYQLYHNAQNENS